MKKIKNLLIGMIVGLANIIPGISGGTIMVLTGVYEPIMGGISDLTNKNCNRKKEIFMYLINILIGAAIGVIAFSYLINYGLENAYVEMMMLFTGAILATVPIFIKKETDIKKINWLLVIIAATLIIFLVSLAPEKSDSVEILSHPKLTLILLIALFFSGLAAGFAMLLPGLSGSMILLIMGKYYLFIYYLKNIIDEPFKTFFPLTVLVVGMFSGIILSAKISKLLLAKYKNTTLSVILGLIFGSIVGLLIIAFREYDHSTLNIVSISIAFLIGALVVLAINQLVKKSGNK